MVAYVNHSTSTLKNLLQFPLHFNHTPSLLLTLISLRSVPLCSIIHRGSKGIGVVGILGAANQTTHHECRFASTKYDPIQSNKWGAPRVGERRGEVRRLLKPICSSKLQVHTPHRPLPPAPPRPHHARTNSSDDISETLTFQEATQLVSYKHGDGKWQESCAKKKNGIRSGAPRTMCSMIQRSGAGCLSTVSSHPLQKATL